jgi:hypothetical protein
MTRKVIASASIGRYQELLDLAIKSFQDYAKKFGYEIAICQTSLDASRPPAWTKILHILELMNEFDEILWIDSDAIIIDISRDIAMDVKPDSELSWVYHEYEDHIHPNSGVMFIRSNLNTQRFFRSANLQTDLTNHPWWDQAALMRLLGMDSEIHPIGPGKDLDVYRIKEQKLSAEWNSIRQHKAEKPRIRHFAGESFFVRKFLMAEHANLNGNAPEVLNFSILELTQMDKLELQNQQLELQNQQLELQNQQLELQNQQLELQNQQLEESRIWRFFSSWCAIRHLKFFKKLRKFGFRL